MGTFTIKGTAKQRGIDKVDQRLVDIMKAAAIRSPYNVELFSGKRFGGGKSSHDHGKAIDIVLKDPETGQEIPNLGAGGKAFDVYEQFAKEARDIQKNMHPEISDSFRWGGYFGPSKLNPSGADHMHFDVRPGGAMSQGSWEGGLNAQGRKRIESLGAGKTYSSQGRRPGELPDTVRTAALPQPPDREGGIDDQTLHTAALTLLGEAAGEGREGMLAVGNVIDNRVDSDRYPNDPLSVMLEPSQFSAWNEGRGGNNPDENYSRSDPIYQEARAAAADTLRNRVPDPTRGGTAYYSPKAMPGGKAPYWWDEESQKGSTQIGNHRFAYGDGQVMPPAPQSPALAAIEQMDPTAPLKTAMAYAPPQPPIRPNLPQKSAAENIADNLSLWDKIRLRKAPETLGAMGNSVAKIADGLGGAGLRMAQPAIDAFEGMTAPTPPPRPAGLPQQAANQPFFPKFPTPPPGLQEATEAKAANMAPPTPIAPPTGLQNQTPNILQQARQGVRGAAPGLFNAIHDIKGQVDGVKIGLQDRARSDLRRALGNRPSTYVDPSETKRMGYQYGPSGYIYGTNTKSGRHEQVGKREDGRDRLYKDVDLTKRKRRYNARTNKWEY